mgnify:FL=1
MGRLSSQETQFMSAHSSILLGAGCFWCVEAVYTGLRGIIAADPG